MPKTQTRFRACCYTLNNYTDENLKTLRSLETQCKYHVYGLEVASTGTPHVQGYIELTKQLSMKQIREMTASHIHIEPRRGSPIQAAAYCKKGTEENDTKYFEEPAPSWNGYEYGKISQPGKRTDLDDAASEIIAGNITADQIAVQNPNLFHQYGRTVRAIEDVSLRSKFRTWMTTAEWIYGETGIGKSHIAFNDYHPDTHYIWKDDNGWQDGYVGQPIVIINEFRGEIKYKDLLELIDKWPTHVRRRGREPAPFLAKHIVITSSLPPNLVYCNLAAKDSLAQLYRRCKVVELKTQMDTMCYMGSSERSELLSGLGSITQTTSESTSE